MSERESLGPIRVGVVSVEGINLALRQVMERLDELKGLRGRTLMFDRLQVSHPTEVNDAVNNPVDDLVLSSHLVYDNATTTMTGAFTFSTSIALSSSVTIDGLDPSVHVLAASDHHTNYALLAGRASGQTLNGGVAASETLTLSSTAHATKGAVKIADLSPFTWSDVNGTVLHQFGA